MYFRMKNSYPEDEGMIDPRELVNAGQVEAPSDTSSADFRDENVLLDIFDPDDKSGEWRM